MACGDRCLYRCILAAVGVVILIVLALLALQYVHLSPPRYYASIPSVALVDSNAELKISVGVKSRWGQACLEHGTDVVVAYNDVPFAFAATGGEVCSGWWKLWRVQRTTVVARAGKVDDLIADALRSPGVFKVTFPIQSAAGSGDGKLVTCMVTPLLDNNGTCHVQYS